MIAEFPILSGDNASRSTVKRTNTRGQSEVITVVLLLFIVILSVAAIVASGSSVLGAARDTAEITAAEHAFEELDADVSAVALGTSPARTTDLGLDANGGEVRYHDTDWIRVDVYSEANGTTNVVNQSLGTIEYRQDETTVAAQGGGVWRSDGDGSTMISRPEFHYREKTLTLPIVAMEGEKDLAKQLQITRDGEPEQKFPNRSAELLNPPDSGTVTVTVQSDYYDAWGRYFETETDAIVSYDHARERVTVLFVVLPGRSTFENGLIATSSTGKLKLDGNGAYINSYDSSVGSYSETKAANGDIQTAGDFLMDGTSLVDGNVNVNGTVTLKGNAKINGSLYWGKAPPDDKEQDKIVGSVNETDGVRTVLPINSFVKNYTKEVKQQNDNSETTAIDSDQLSLTGGSATLGEGSYYLEDITLEGETLFLDTTDGDIEVVVRDYVKLTKGGNITVVGDGSVTVVVAGETDTKVTVNKLGTRDVNFHVGKGGSAVHVPDEVSSQFQVYGTDEFNATIVGASSNNAKFDGIIYAPAGTTGSGYVHIKHGELYGLTVTGELSLGLNGKAHYDYGLIDNTQIRSPYSEVEQIHVTVHHARVAGGT